MSERFLDRAREWLDENEIPVLPERDRYLANLLEQVVEESVKHEPIELVEALLDSVEQQYDAGHTEHYAVRNWARLWLEDVNKPEAAGEK